MEELAKLLGTTKENLTNLSDAMGEFTGRPDVPEKLLEKIRVGRQEAIRQIGLTENSTRKEILDGLKRQAAAVEGELLEIFHNPNLQDHGTVESLFKQAFNLAKPKKGLFLKEEKAREFLQKNPPKNVLDHLGYTSVDSMLAKEDLLEVYSSLRFLEERKWLNEIFFVPFSSFTPKDFEKREVVLRILDPAKWGVGARDFVRKKFHNTTHLKELGVVVVIPVEYTAGVLTRMFSMMLHYLNEVAFYAKFFELLTDRPDDFAQEFVSALRGDVRDSIPPVENMFSWIIMQRYLAKERPTDPRLLIPRVSPEALHWKKAVANLAQLGKNAKGLASPKAKLDGVGFWEGRAELCGFLPAGRQGFEGQLTSFNFADNVFSLAAGPDTEQYTYHAREALWNRLFIEYFDNGEKVLETLLIEEFAQGFIGFKIRATRER